MFKINSGIGLSLLCVFVLHNFAFDQANVFRDGAQIFFLVLFFSWVLGNSQCFSSVRSPALFSAEREPVILCPRALA